MIARTLEFKAEFGTYGPGYRSVGPDYDFCAEKVWRGHDNGQCTRKNGHGPHGAWCKQHDPIAKKKRGDVQMNKWRTKWDAEARLVKARDAMLPALVEIADGHNDPRALAQSVIDEFTAAKDALK